ncbi:dethiobiotin synthase [Croceivirga thetidis]|uniref:ATP-dependent dethiobiotin synthetase BioD n=1 Tax=Croceivirga thetidis TaxID=2721623 RepID=A0ABX1GNJ2_9FLAO|nr:dethiobiotin synthase [Croceivirga thetidis]NKI31493.1 dethiobiotin synthase [Croceivirga thetidis]
MKIFVTGISTEVGKTLISAILVEALEADYWKPVQAGDLDNSDSHKVERLISNSKTKIHPNSYALETPMSPHGAADIDGIKIDLEKIIEPKTNGPLVIEGAGGLLVPLNDTDTILDLIKAEHKVVVVSRHYLGSINHSLLTITTLQEKGLDIGIIFSGNEHPTTESIILKKTNVNYLGRVNEEEKITKEIVKSYAEKFKPALLNW